MSQFDWILALAVVSTVELGVICYLVEKFACRMIAEFHDLKVELKNKKGKFGN